VSIALCAMLLLSAFVTIATDNVSAAQDGDYTFVLSDSLPTVATIIAYNGPGGDITIPSTLGGHPVVTIGILAFAYSSLTSVAMGNSVASIYWRAFYASTSLSHVTIPASVTFIGDRAFESCISLSSISFLGLVAPSTGVDWIYDTSAGITGHAYANSNFPAPGGVFHGLPMGSSIFGSPISDDDMSMIWWALAIVVVVAIVLFLFYGRKEGKEIAPSEFPAAQWAPNEPNANKKGLLFNRVQTQAPPPRNQYNQPPAQSRSYAHCPWCGAQTTESPFCGYCGGKLKR
jgi:hypothetical protein